jgi:hypothetical protein
MSPPNRLEFITDIDDKTTLFKIPVIEAVVPTVNVSRILRLDPPMAARPTVNEDPNCNAPKILASEPNLPVDPTDTDDPPITDPETDN